LKGGAEGQFENVRKKTFVGREKDIFILPVHGARRNKKRVRIILPKWEMRKEAEGWFRARLPLRERAM